MGEEVKRPKASREALIVIDMLNDFCTEGAPLYVPATAEAIPNIAREMKRFRDAGGPIIFVCDSHAPDDPEFRYWPPHSVAGSEGAQVVEGLSPLPGEFVVEKTTLSPFYKTRLHSILQKARVTDVTITGCVTEICVLFCVFEAMSRGYRVTVPKDCVAGLTPAASNCAIDEMRDVLKAEVL